jgi:hypothetical protein
MPNSVRSSGAAFRHWVKRMRTSKTAQGTRSVALLDQALVSTALALVRDGRAQLAVALNGNGNGGSR